MSCSTIDRPTTEGREEGSGWNEEFSEMKGAVNNKVVVTHQSPTVHSVRWTRVVAQTLLSQRELGTRQQDCSTMGGGRVRTVSNLYYKYTACNTIDCIKDPSRHFVTRKNNLRTLAVLKEVRLRELYRVRYLLSATMYYRLLNLLDRRTNQLTCSTNL